MKRLEGLPTLRIDPARRIGFTYKGYTRHGVVGDSVATALYAEGVRIFSRSMKYRRPRGLFSLDGICANTFLTIGKMPNMAAETVALREAMTVEEQNVYFTARNDPLAFLDRFDRFMPAGFYYESMHKPASLWPAAAEVVRRAAGLGQIDPGFRFSGVCDEIYPATDVCVIGGGVAGMSAALAAAEQGMRVILLEARHWLGGACDYRSQPEAGGRPMHARSAALAENIAANPFVRVFTGASMVGGYADNLVTAVAEGKEDDPFDYRYMEIRAKSVVVATGTRERPLIFEDNDRPGVMLPDCALRLAHTYGILPGREAVFSVGHDFGLETAVALADLGLPVRAVADFREAGHDAGLVDQLASRNIPFFPGWAAYRASGVKSVSGVRLAACRSGESRRFACDLLVAAAGLSPVAEPLALFCDSPEADANTGFFLPKTYPPGVFAAGSILGFLDPRSRIDSGEKAGIRAARFCGADSFQQAPEMAGADDLSPPPNAAPVWLGHPGRESKQFVCFDEDVTVKHIRQAISRGFTVPELIKRFSAAGTGPGQGGISGHNLPLLVHAIRSESAGCGPSDIDGNTGFRPTKARPPVRPVLLAAYAGTGREMTKRTPAHDIQAREGAVFRRAGAWQRARYFSQDLDVSEEVLAVRTNVGMLDASTLGCLRIFGPDALSALQRVYAGDMAKILDGRVKYGAMCNHDGCVIDDGVVIRTGENDYMFTTATGRAGETIEWIRYHTRFDNLAYHLVNLTDGTAVINLAGPRARDVLEKITDADVSGAALPFGGWMDFTLTGGIPVRCMRLGFVGELSFELNIPASYMAHVWEMARRAGRDFGIRSIGVEAQNVLRLEKGHVILGQESEQRTNLIDLGLGFLWARDKTIRPVGSDALRQAENDPGRLKLAGIRMKDPAVVPPDGSAIIPADGPEKRIVGYIGTIRKSLSPDMDGAVVGMALVEDPWSREGTTLAIYDGENPAGSGAAFSYAVVVRMPFYDPDGKRMRM